MPFVALLFDGGLRRRNSGATGNRPARHHHAHGDDMAQIEDIEKTPFWVHCKTCGHEWILLYAPIPMAKFARIAKSPHCPKCHEEKKVFCGRDDTKQTVVSIKEET